MSIKSNSGKAINLCFDLITRDKEIDKKTYSEPTFSGILRDKTMEYKLGMETHPIVKDKITLSV